MFPNAETIEIREMVWTGSSVVLFAVSLFAVWQLLQKWQILRGAGENGTIALIYIEKLVLHVGLLLIGGFFAALGWSAMETPRPQIEQVATNNSFAVYVLMGVNIALAMYGIFDIWITDRIEEGAVKAHALKETMQTQIDDQRLEIDDQQLELGEQQVRLDDQRTEIADQKTEIGEQQTRLDDQQVQVEVAAQTIAIVEANTIAVEENTAATEANTEMKG